MAFSSRFLVMNVLPARGREEHLHVDLGDSARSSAWTALQCPSTAITRRRTPGRSRPRSPRPSPATMARSSAAIASRFFGDPVGRLLGPGPGVLRPGQEPDATGRAAPPPRRADATSPPGRVARRSALPARRRRPASGFDLYRGLEALLGGHRLPLDRVSIAMTGGAAVTRDPWSPPTGSPAARALTVRLTRRAWLRVRPGPAFSMSPEPTACAGSWRPVPHLEPGDGVVCDVCKRQVYMRPAPLDLSAALGPGEARRGSSPSGADAQDAGRPGRGPLVRRLGTGSPHGPTGGTRTPPARRGHERPEEV